MKKNTTIKNTLKYDIAFINPSVDKVFEAIELQKNGQKTLLVFQNEIKRTDHFQITKTFPDSLFYIYKLTRKSRMLKKMFLLCPHLIQPQKIIVLKPKHLKTLARFINFFYKNQLKEKSTIINRTIPENLSFLNLNLLKGIIFQEYKINVSRLFIEFLKYFEIFGGKVITNKDFYEDEISTIIKCRPKNNLIYLTNINCPSNFVLETKEKNGKFRLLENNNLIAFDFCNSKTKHTKSEVQKIIQKIISTKNITINEIENNFWLSTKNIGTILKTVKSPLPGSFAHTTIKDNYELSLEKFDVAKQTGITYPEFKVLFHRYGNGIDEMIDEAYEEMNKTRDPQKIWNRVENWYQKKYEWLV